MEMLDYTQAAIEFLKKPDVPNTHFIFMIDGSWSMEGGDWATQIQELKKIVKQLTNRSNSWISIVQFASSFNVEITKADIGKDYVDVDGIPFRGGGTCF